MTVAVYAVFLPHHAAFVNDAPGAASYKKQLAYLIVMIALILAGPGRYSLDARLLRRWRSR